LVSFMRHKNYKCEHFDNINTICYIHSSCDEVFDVIPLKNTWTRNTWMNSVFSWHRLDSSLVIDFEASTFKTTLGKNGVVDGGKHDPRMIPVYNAKKDIKFPLAGRRREIFPERTVNKRTLLIFRKDDHNPFFMYSLAFNIWVAKIDVEQIIFMDEAPKQESEKLFSLVIAPIMKLPTGKVQFTNAWLSPSEYTGALMDHLNDAQPCKESFYVTRFAQKVVGNIKRLQQRVIFVSRQNYNGRRLGRVLKNENEIIEATRTLFPTIQKVVFENMTFDEQVRISAEATYMFGMHGAGLANALWMQKGAHLIEIFPKHKRRWGYRNIAQYKGFSYTQFRGGIDGENDSKRIDVNDWKSFLHNIRTKTTPPPSSVTP